MGRSSLAFLKRLVVSCVLTAGVTFAASAGALAGAATSTYTLTVVGQFHNTGRGAVALNDRGHVTSEGIGNAAFLYNGSLHSLGKPAGAAWSIGEGISNGDVVSATAQDTNGIRRAYAVTYTNGRAHWTPLPGLAGYTLSEADAITPDGSSIVGTLCRTGDRACSGAKRPLLAAVWRRAGGVWRQPILVPGGKSSGGARGIAIARAGSVTVAAAGNIVWPLHAGSFLALRTPGKDTVSAVESMAHARGNTFFVAGQSSNPNIGSITEALLWTVRCTHARCIQTDRRVLTNYSAAFAVNSAGVVAGYSRPNEDGGGFYLIWEGNTTSQLPIEPFGINSSGQLAGLGQNPKTFRIDQVALLTPSSS
ncbi:MAG: hypothetical protein ACRDFS_09525 [Chloroflexota bacterium]